MWIRLACITAFPAACAVRFYVVDDYGKLGPQRRELRRSFLPGRGSAGVDPGQGPGNGPKLVERAKW